MVIVVRSAVIPSMLRRMCERELHGDPPGPPELPSTSEFLRAESKEATIISGLTMGAELSVPDGQDEPRVLTVRRICSAYRRLLELSQLALNAPLTPSPVARVVSDHNEETGEPDFSGLTRQLKQFSDQAKKTIDVYASSPTTLGGARQLARARRTRCRARLTRGWPGGSADLADSGGESRRHCR